MQNFDNLKLNESKICVSCHKPFNNRKKWRLRGIWNDVIYCSDRCRKVGRVKK